MATLTQIRQAVAPLIGPFYAGTATSGSSASLLEMTAAPFKTALQADAFFEGYHLFRPGAALAADKARIVRIYAPSSGQFTPDLAWTNAPYAGGVGESIELHAVVPPVGDGITDLHALINEGLKRIPLVVEFTFSTSSATAKRHSLASAASWLTRQRWVRKVGRLPSGQTDRSIYTPAEVSGWMEQDGNTIYLCGFSSATTDTIYVTAVKPAYYHCRVSGGTFGGQSGLSLETDEAPVPLDWIAQATLIEVWERLGRDLEASGAGRVQQELSKAAARYTRLTRQYLQLPGRTFRPYVRFGPTR